MRPAAVAAPAGIGDDADVLALRHPVARGDGRVDVDVEEGNGKSAADIDRDAAGARIEPAHGAVHGRVRGLATGVLVGASEIEGVLVLPETAAVTVTGAVVP